MKTRILMTMMIAMMVNAVIFGIGTITVLAYPPLQNHAFTLLPWVIGAAFTLSPIVSWLIAPSLLVHRGEMQEGAVQPARGEIIPAE